MTATLSQLAPENALRRLELAIVRRLDGLLQGDHLGLLPGTGTELAESREYVPGEDDVRRMDWAVTARTTIPHVRDAVADRELETWALVDLTASMDFGTVELEKRELAIAAVACVGFLTDRIGNRLGAHVLTANGVTRYPARTGRVAMLGLLRRLLAIHRGEPGERPAPAEDGRERRRPPSLEDAIEALQRTTRRSGLSVVISDFLDESDWERALRRLNVRHQILAIEIVDPRELELPDVGVLAVIDPETGRRREVDTASRKLRERFASAAAEERREIKEKLRRSGAGHLVLRTDRDWVRDVARFVLSQRRVAHLAAGPVKIARPAGGTS